MVRRVVGYCREPGVVRRSLIVAVLVGTLLNLINQGDALFAGRTIDWAKVLLTFIVPYCVATYGAVSYRLRHERDLASERHSLRPHGSSPGRSGGNDYARMDRRPGGLAATMLEWDRTWVSPERGVVL